MENKNAETQAQEELNTLPLTANHEKLGLSRKEALDELYKICAESKRQIARRECYTHDEVWASIELKSQLLRKGK